MKANWRMNLIRPHFREYRDQRGRKRVIQDLRETFVAPKRKRHNALGQVEMRAFAHWTNKPVERFRFR
jgi:hypothetical protein